MGNDLLEAITSILETVNRSVEIAADVEEVIGLVRHEKAAKRTEDTVTSPPLTVEDSALALIEAKFGNQIADPIRRRLREAPIQGRDAAQEADVDRLIAVGQANARRIDAEEGLGVEYLTLRVAAQRARHRAPQPFDPR